MESFPWWSEEQKKLADEIEAFVKEMMPEAEEAWWKREIALDVFQKVAQKGYLGAGIPEIYGGMGLGVTGSAIAMEVLSLLPGAFYICGASMMGGLHQIREYGNEEQQKRLLPRIARGELGAIAITEPFAGTDASAIETTARREGNKYILNGKKRFVTGLGTAHRYMLYARTSEDPQQVARYEHLTGFIVEKGMSGFTVEKVNEIIGYDNTPNGYLNLDDVPVPVENRIGKEGEGWRVMTSGLNFERIIVAASLLGAFHTAVRTAVGYGQRRIQFGRPTLDLLNNQFKVADLIMKLKLSRLATYYAAYMFDLDQDSSVASSICKVFNTDISIEAMSEAIQVMGGDGVTKFYPLERLLREAKTNQIAGGTSEAVRLVIYRLGLRQMEKDLEWPHRIVHPELGVPVSGKPTKQIHINEEKLLKILAEDYRVNPGLYMSRDDLKRLCDVEDETLDGLLASLEQKKLVKLYRKKKGIELAKATYEGLKKANPPEYYRWFPPWIKKEYLF
jgi:alkylation response protein AidB-like acyl-CoA dehydrogenase